MRKKAGKALLWLLVLMAVFTGISRMTASFSIAKVSVELPSSRKILHVVTAAGTVRENLELAVLTEPNLLVKAVYVAEGQKVEADELLAELDCDELAEQIETRKEELRIMELSNAALAAADARAAENASRALARAKEDYEQIVEETTLEVNSAAEALKKASDACHSFAETIGAAEDSDAAYTQFFALRDTMHIAQEAYDAAVLRQQAALRQAERAVADAGLPQVEDNQDAINRIRMGQMEREIAALELIAEESGKITAPVEGMVTAVYVRTGQRTTDTAAFAMADVSAGVRFTTLLGAGDASYVSVGDEVTIKKNKNVMEGLTVETVEKKEDGSAEVTVLIDREHMADIEIGDMVMMEAKQDVAQSPIVIPLTALHQTNEKYFVYVPEAVETVLGTEYRAMQIEVTVEDNNAEYAAITEGVISADTQVIVNADRYIEAGSKVRLLGQ